MAKEKAEKEEAEAAELLAGPEAKPKPPAKPTRPEEEAKPAPKEIPEKVKKEIELLKVKLGDFRKTLLKKFTFISAIGMLPPQASKIVEEEEEVPDELKGKLMHLLLVLPDEKEKEAAKVKTEAVKLIQGMKPQLWIHIKTPSQLWELCYDGKFELMEAMAMSFPLYDKGILGALRVSNIHKSLILRKFERYIVAYVIAGSVVRGKTTKTSDVDVFVIIDDTDVKRMTRTELKEKLRAIIYERTFEAADIAGVHNKLSPQVYILTEFWEAVREAHPVIFTFIRDGVPLYDRGTFMPWKLLLKMGKITGTPEAIERFMLLGEKLTEIVRRKLNEIATEDIYWTVITPSQGVLMLYGLAPPTPAETVELIQKIFVEREKLLEKKYADILAKIVGIYKAYEHEKIKAVSGKEIDELVKQAESYRERLKKLAKELEKRRGEKTILELYDDTFSLLQNILGKGSEQQLIKRFETELIETGRLAPTALETLKGIAKAKQDYVKGKPSKLEIEQARKATLLLIGDLTDYVQKSKLLRMEKSRFPAKIAGKEGELFLLGKTAYVIPDIKEAAVKKVDIQKNKLVESSREELETELRAAPKEVKIASDALDKIEKLLKKKIELVL